jgi:hypothetical protein
MINQILYRMQVAGWRSDLLEVVRQAPTVTKRNTGYSGEMFKSELLFFYYSNFSELFFFYHTQILSICWFINPMNIHEL